MKLLVTGNEGGLGSATVAASRAAHDVVGVGLPEVDIAEADAVRAVIAEHRPELVINCAAFTNVDGCVSDYETAYRVNAVGPLVLANACREAGIPLVHISSNEVFDGTREDGYEEWMASNPVNAYGMTKAAGEFNVRAVLPQHYLVRTAWLMALQGRNFVHAILRRARSGQGLRVVTDEVGNPTFVDDLAKAILQLIETGQYGTYHFVNEGACSRWEFANEILRQAGLEEVENEPILSSEFERVSRPPANSSLLNRNGAALGITLWPWQEALGEFLERLEAQEELAARKG